MGTINRELPCRLTYPELDRYRDELARLTTEETEIEERKKEVVSDFKARLDKCSAERRLIARKISTKQEHRQVECRWIRDFDSNRAELIRLDTMEVVDVRALTAEERQQELELHQNDTAGDGDGAPEDGEVVDASFDASEESETLTEANATAPVDDLPEEEKAEVAAEEGKAVTGEISDFDPEYEEAAAAGKFGELE